MKMAHVLALALATTATGLKVTAPPSSYAYVGMWINHKNVPAGMELVKPSFMTAAEEKAELKVMQEEGSEFAGAQLKRSVAEESLASESEWTGDGNHAALKMAVNLQQVGSKFPYVLVTNMPSLVEIKYNKTLQEQYPNVRIHELKTKDDYLKVKCKTAKGHSLHFQKFAVFGLTQYERVMWLDMDVVVKKNLDSLFEQYDVKNGEQIWGQRDNWSCDDKDPKANYFSSGMMLFKPDQKHVNGLIDQANSENFCWGDQKMIAKYFSSDGRHRGLFPKEVINWGHCGGNGGAMAVHAQLTGR
eukprot:gnl/MRDRNA2_/MRDRNA2_115629_c0_seq1.p1 gnl/MRDRNA2_/MRDRNA2_115629_c0~~gnl/MRDRNA2_/MRDRNA2_115629_c0_seq1.p1  ORF type:complete len:301 (-),score=66.23 gnl/MRDRNA2_/MRDRNA2_115629_c0_seq1:26-928(-)